MQDGCLPLTPRGTTNELHPPLLALNNHAKRAFLKTTVSLSTNYK